MNDVTRNRTNEQGFADITATINYTEVVHSVISGQRSRGVEDKVMGHRA